MIGTIKTKDFGRSTCKITVTIEKDFFVIRTEDVTLEVPVKAITELMKDATKDQEHGHNYNGLQPENNTRLLTLQ